MISCKQGFHSLFSWAYGWQIQAAKTPLYLGGSRTGGYCIPAHLQLYQYFLSVRPRVRNILNINCCSAAVIIALCSRALRVARSPFTQAAWLAVWQHMVVCAIWWPPRTEVPQYGGKGKIFSAGAFLSSAPYGESPGLASPTSPSLFKILPLFKLTSSTGTTWFLKHCPVASISM